MYVLLGPRPNTEQTTEQTPDQSALTERLREEVAYLRGVIATRDRELAQRTEEIRRRDAALEREQELTAMFAERLRQLEAPPAQGESSEPRESPVSPGPRESPTEGSEGPQRPAERPWWRRLLGG